MNVSNKNNERINELKNKCRQWQQFERSMSIEIWGEKNKNNKTEK